MFQVHRKLASRATESSPSFATPAGRVVGINQIPRHDALGDASRAMDKQQASLEAGKKKVRAIEL